MSDAAAHNAAPSEHTPDIASGMVVSNQALTGSESQDTRSEENCSSQDPEEEALESHEVIELQAFSERKAWIEEKIKFLESLPPIEVFVGIDALRDSAESIPGLPTRQQLQEWLAEHDRIEKETEIFDSGELKKLRKFTKAATQRHLSPEDTDLIELTLTTIYELDKLLHLLRDRSEQLDLLGVRLTWEELRTAAWSDLRKILSDIGSFLVTRARWSPSIYDVMTKAEERPSARRGSIASMASDTSVTSGSGFSRSARFKLAELLSRDAAQIAGKISSLRHGKIAAAGKALDKLIDNSRKPVPEELLDEQDKLEEKGINDMEDVGKFVMNVVTQWRKADELYVETVKDRNAAQNLLEEIETAKLYHPTPRQCSSFISRADTLVKRLALRGNPLLNASLFPCPIHPLFPEQAPFNTNLRETLSSELSSTEELVSRLDALAREYRTGYEAVKEVDTLSQNVGELQSLCHSIIDRLSNGVTTSDGDGSPPDLSTERCLEPTAHAAFLTLLPTVLQEADYTKATITKFAGSYQLALHNLDRPGIDLVFKQTALARLDSLISVRDKALDLIDDTNARVTRLRAVKRVWSMMDSVKKELRAIQADIAEILIKDRWKQRMDTMEPLTPQTSDSEFSLPTCLMSPSNILTRLDGVRHMLSHDVEVPMDSLSKASLEQPLHTFLSRASADLMERLDNIQGVVPLMEAIRSQSLVMAAIQDEVHDLQVKLEDLRIRYDVVVEEILTGDVSTDTLEEEKSQLQADSNSLREAVRTFTDGIAKRVQFVSCGPSSLTFGKIFVRKKASSVDLRGVNSDLPSALEFPFTLANLDNAVRADCNSFTMRLAGEVGSLDRKTDALKLACMAKDADTGIASTTDDLRTVNRELESLRSTLYAISQREEKLERLQVLSQDVERHASHHRSRLFRSLSLIRESLRQMETVASSQTMLHEPLLTTRRRAVDDLEIKVNSWGDRVAVLLSDVSESLLLETRKLEAVRVQREKEAEERERLARILEERRLEEEQRVREQLALAEAERLGREQLARERAEREAEEQLAREKEEREQRLAREAAEREAEERATREKAEKEAEEQAHHKKAEKEAKEWVACERADIEAEEQSTCGQAEVEARLTCEKAEQEAQEQITRKGTETQTTADQPQEKETPQTEKVQHGESDDGLKTNATEQPSWNTRKRSGTVHLLTLSLDVFGLRVGFSPSLTNGQGKDELLDLIVSLRKRLRSLSINEVARPPAATASTAQLPTLEQYGRLNSRFTSILSEVARLPSSETSPASELELRSLMTEVDASKDLMLRIRHLADLADAANNCDNALSDLLEHIDSYPGPPAGPLSSTHISNPRLPPEEQLSARVGFTRRTVAQVSTYLEPIDDDVRAVAEQERIQQTWTELEEMANDRINGRKSRPSSVLSTSRNSSASGHSSHSVVSTPKNGAGNHKRKASGYSTLSVQGSTRDGFLTPSHPSLSRRAVSGTSDTTRRPSSKLSMLSTESSRSVSGPVVSRPVAPTSSLYNSTFASRQRTASLSSNAPGSATRPSPSARPRAQTKSRASPTPSEVSIHSRSNHPRPSSSMSTWARAPRQSFPTSNRVQTPPRRTQPTPKKAYIANPKNKLDVAVGDVVNKLPVNINVEVVADTWKDQSGKYWIGDQEPKLCFCRILRSQTVMVRVGGGWQELSKFIKDHFADMFRIMPPDTPTRFGSPRFGSREEKWISSATLLEAPEITTSPPRTPEPRGPSIPSFLLSTPSAHSPHSAKSTPSSGSPLAPLQFMRLAAPDSTLIRPVTPSRPSTHRSRSSIPNTPARHTVWRP
ncbi:hypothetical protein ID866_4708 [Astraeus odoratus]|nr:hypothetical protein ID866_4708 [Astraeus odoratus]